MRKCRKCSSISSICHLSKLDCEKYYSSDLSDRVDSLNLMVNDRRLFVSLPMNDLPEATPFYLNPKLIPDYNILECSIADNDTLEFPIKFTEIFGKSISKSKYNIAVNEIPPAPVNIMQ